MIYVYCFYMVFWTHLVPSWLNLEVSVFRKCEPYQGGIYPRTIIWLSRDTNYFRNFHEINYSLIKGDLTLINSVKTVLNVIKYLVVAIMILRRKLMACYMTASVFVMIITRSLFRNCLTIYIAITQTFTACQPFTTPKPKPASHPRTLLRWY